ncbi:MAG: putative selenium-dependent hydroxylase accessory protein YqeC [Firmicutes bacterium]|nr:putative selenium-dependent hydroxylase accessory protein YqeC [Bacillota bacterium]
MIIAVVGSGGKTTLIKKMAQKYLAEGKRVLVTTSTHMLVEEDTLVDADAKTIINQLENKGYAMAGSKVLNSPEEKITALPKAVYEEVCNHADVVLVEADGSKRLPIKYPSATEPVIPDNTDEIIVVCGLQGLGKPAKDVCHRLELVKECLGIQDDTIVDHCHVQKLLEEGYLKPLRTKYPSVPVKLHIVQDGSLYQRTIASLLMCEQDVSFVKKEWFCPQPKLIICGGGHVAKEVAEFAAQLDFYVKVIDDRAELVTEERFLTANERICDSFSNLNKYLENDAYYVVVTPNHKADYECVSGIMATRYKYLGMIGSRTKVAKTKQQLELDGFSKEQIDTLYAPIGLAIGAVTPAEIAISILAQIIQIKNVSHAASADMELLTAKEDGVLCIITDKSGSAPRGVGSMMLVCKDRIIGSIGGGEAEYLAIENARKIETFNVKTYALNVEKDEGIEMICGGNIQITFVPLNC